jgi:hypothetical protein
MLLVAKGTDETCGRSNKNYVLVQMGEH